MSAFLTGLDPLHLIAGAVIIALLIARSIGLKVFAIYLAFRLSREAIRHGLPAEAAAGKEFYFRTPSASSSKLTRGKRQVPTIRPPRPTEFSERLKALRQSRGYTLIDFAKRIGVSVSIVSALETGRADLSDEHLQQIAAALNLSPDDTVLLEKLAREQPFQPKA